MGKKTKYLLKNFGFLLIGNFSSKILNFLLVPLYTATLTTEEFGSYDIVYDTILLLIPILSLNITDAIMRFTIDAEEERKNEVVCISNKYMILACSVFIIGLTGFRFLTNNNLAKRFFIHTIILFVCTLVQQNLVQIARGFEKIKIISINGVIGTLVAVLSNIYFLVVKHYGLEGYFAANILSLAVQIVFLSINTNVIKISVSGSKKTGIEKEMLLFCVPLMATTLSWHINSVADRYTVTMFEGLGANGVYAVSYKIPAIMTAVQYIFIQSWQLSAVKEFKSEEGKKFVNETYVAVQTVMIFLCSFTIIFTRLLAKMFFKADFYDAWICVPTLVFYVMFNTMSGTLGGIFSAVKDTKAFMYTAIIGAIANVIMNFFFVWWLGILGAAIATAISSVIIWALRLHATKKYISINYLKNNGMLQIILLVIQATVMTAIKSVYGYFLQVIIMICLLICNKDQVCSWISKLNITSKNRIK